MKIYDRAGSPNAARIRIALAAKDLEDNVDFVSIDLIGAQQKSDAYLAKNPIGKIPLLELDDGAVISESTAITEYLDNLDGNPLLTGKTPREKGLIHMMQRRVEQLVMEPIDDYFHYGNLLTGRTNNPWNLDRTPGGSSGGESAAIAAGMSPLGLGSDVAISVRGPAAHTGIVGLKATHGRIPTTGHWPEVPRRFWHVGPMARTVRDITLAYSLLAGPDGIDGYATSPIELTAGAASKPAHELRIGWLVEPGFGPISPDVGAAVAAAAKAFADLGFQVKAVRLPALEENNGLELYSKLHVLETKPVMARVTDGHANKTFKFAARILAAPDPSAADYIAASQAAEDLRSGFADYFRHYDALLCPVTPLPAPPHDLSEFVINGETVTARHILRATVPFNLTGLPALSMRFGTSGDGLPIGIQIVSRWFAETRVLDLAARLESVSGVAGLHPETTHA